MGPFAVLCEVLKEDGAMARVPDLTRFCRTHKLEMINISDLVRYRSAKNNERPSGAIKKVVQAVA
jgi:3,4-dihydroxy 2-butanone 4-phosphate synthase/GTP cyclohydrolase II